MSIKQLSKCDDCGKIIKKIHFFQNKSVCGMCYRKYFIIIPSCPMIDSLNQTVSFSVSLTESQKNMLDKRVKYLFPEMKNSRKKYLKELILRDIESWNNKKNIKR